MRSGRTSLLRVPTAPTSVVVVPRSDAPGMETGAGTGGGGGTETVAGIGRVFSTPFDSSAAHGARSAGGSASVGTAASAAGDWTSGRAPTARAEERSTRPDGGEALGVTERAGITAAALAPR